MKKLKIAVSIMVGILMFILGTKAGDVIGRITPSETIQKEVSELNLLADQQRVAYDKLSKMTTYDKSIHKYVISLKDLVPKFSMEKLGEQVEAFKALSKFRSLLLEKVSFDSPAKDAFRVCSEILTLDMEMSYHQDIIAHKISY